MTKFAIVFSLLAASCHLDALPSQTSGQNEFTAEVQSDRANASVDVAAQSEQIAASIADSTGYWPVIHKNWGQATERAPTIQVIEAISIEGARFSLMLPPGWSPTAAFPVMLSSNKDVMSNDERLLLEGDVLAARAAGHENSETSGMIVAITDTADAHDYHVVANFLDWLDQNGGDKYNVVTSGVGSNASTALLWAMNPLALDYDVHTSFLASSQRGQLPQYSVIESAGISRTRELLDNMANRQQLRDLDPNNLTANLLSDLLSPRDRRVFLAHLPLDNASASRHEYAGNAHGTAKALSAIIASVDLHHSIALSLTTNRADRHFFESLVQQYLSVWNDGVATDSDGGDNDNSGDYPDYPWYPEANSDYPDYPWYAEANGDYPD